MHFWSFWRQSLVVVAALGLSVTAAPQLSTRQTAADATPADTTAASAAKQAAALLASMPTCGRNCLLGAIAASPCELTDIACSCSNATITAEVEVCITKGCTVKEGLTSQNATSVLCSKPIRDGTDVVSYSGSIGGALAVIAYLMRMTSRLPKFGGVLGWDDAVITLAVLEVIPLSVLSVVLANYGLGKDIWTVPFENITAILKIYYYDEDLYLTALPLVKISILFFYLRIFPQNWFRYACFATMAACVGYGIAFLLVSVFQCTPINLAWDHWDGEHFGRCNNINAQAWTSAAINVILDVVVLALPMPVIAKLELNKRKKALIVLMFSTGFVVTIISILRLQVLVHFGGTNNFTWHYRAVGYWSTIETDLAVICACMPGIRALVMWSAPRMMGESTRGQSPGPSKNFSGYGTGQSGPSNDKRSLPSLLSKGEKDWVPLVEVTNKDGRSPSDPDNGWPLRMDESSAWEEPKQPRRMSLKRHSLSNGAKTWKVSMDA